PRRRGRDPDHLQGRGAVVADGEPLQDHERGQVRFRLRGRLDAQGYVDLPRRGAQERRQPAGDRAGRPVLRGGAEDGRPPLGHVEPDCKVGTVTVELSMRRLLTRLTENLTLTATLLMGLHSIPAQAQIPAPQAIDRPVPDAWRAPLEQFLRDLRFADLESIIATTKAGHIGGALNPSSIV